MADDSEHEEPRWMTTWEVSKMIGQSPDTVRRMCEGATWPNAYRRHTGAPWRIPLSDVEAWQESMKPVVRRRAPQPDPPADG